MNKEYYLEPFNVEEQRKLRPYVDGFESPVFALTSMPEITKAALFARYSRTPKSLRRLVLDEFINEQTVISENSNFGTERASKLFGRVLSEFGDDSVAQLGGIHIACEQVSQPLAKAIEWGRLMAYLEQSTRYIPYSDKRDGHYRYYRDPELLASPLGTTFITAMDGLFDTYVELLAPMQEYLDNTLPQEEDTAARKRAIRALALDVLRGLLPAGTVSNVGVFGSPQAFEQLVLRLRSHPLPEAQRYAELVAIELQRVAPDFVSRLDRPDRGGVWTEYLRETSQDLKREARELITETDGALTESVTLLDWTQNAEEKIMTTALYPYADVSVADVLQKVSGLSNEQQNRLFATVVGKRGNRRHKPGRSFEHAEYTFEIVSDYGAFRDLQRHRMLTIQWQTLTPHGGYSVPEKVAAAGLAAKWSAAVAQAEAAYSVVHQQFPEQASYLVTLGHRLRYLIKLNAREAMHLIELRTSPQGHPSYRKVGQAMHQAIDQVAGHHRIAQAMQFVGSDDVHLPRYQAEKDKTPASV